MRIVSNLTEAEVVATFLRAEIDSPTWSPFILSRLLRLGKDRHLIDSPLYQEPDNRLRSDILGRTDPAGYRAGLFVHFPQELLWQRVVLDRLELERISYINQNKWLRLSGNTGKAIDAANRINSGFRESDLVEKIISTSKTCIPDISSVPEIILVSKGISAPPVALEGNTRITAYLMHSSLAELSVIIGLSSELSSWLQRNF